MRWLLLLLLLPIALGEVWMVTNASYEFTITSERSGLAGITFELLGDCNLNISARVGSQMLYEGTEANITFEPLPRNSEVTVAIANKHPDSISTIKLPYNESIFAELEPDVIIGEQVQVMQVKKHKTSCALVSGEHPAMIIYDQQPGVEYTLEAEPEPIQVETHYKGNMLKDIIADNKQTIILHFLLIVLFVIGCFYVSWKRMIEVLFFTVIVYYITMRAIVYIVPVSHVMLLPTVWILSIAYLITHFRKVMQYFRQ